jgi:hypothetical protein|tara:strand:- start:233 stop:466 length:234 start_codon:yes stop_codon:yes gene_type:complete
MSWEYADFLNPPINIWRGTKQTRGLTTATTVKATAVRKSFPRMIARFTIYLLSTIFIYFFHFYLRKNGLESLAIRAA